MPPTVKNYYCFDFSLLNDALNKEGSNPQWVPLKCFPSKDSVMLGGNKLVDKALIRYIVTVAELDQKF
ncbi:hypothetical protein Hdeb2414_s0008g00279721 [Helianthus debilis subsp. tardiflorus]